jgi:hypothetical protein
VAGAQPSCGILIMENDATRSRNAMPCNARISMKIKEIPRALTCIGQNIPVSCCAENLNRRTNQPISNMPLQSKIVTVREKNMYLFCCDNSARLRSRP